MLILQPELMRLMENDHLIRSLECESSLMRTPVELELMWRCESLMDELELKLDSDDVSARISEAAAQFPEEDFLEKFADRIFELGKKLRGDNKSEAHAIAAELTEFGQTLANAFAYGKDELNQIFNPKKENTPCE